MKKLIGVMVVGVLVATASLVVAQPEKGMGEGMGKGAMMGEGMMGKEMMKDKMMMGHGMMMQGMMSKSMVATSDGGVIVLSGNKLTKYDKDLNVIKEVELKADEHMQKMMEKCPMMGKGMMGGKGDTMGQEETKTEPASAEEQAEHESHHK